ncbi:arylsulfatase [Promicromonospora sp. AC04]|uniref:arylsulfatase n=1 Tax=Promicromonospora sp. AC04 TaxID=2135723 RepID=UPI000D338F3C|nr:arylsulfatase [Promicromonospora sp. AC04]PUB26271.1 arylsulfatase [Promicromonospora sp. AC04]
MTRSPDVLVVLADDLGYSDVGVFGGEIDTPALDRLARRGVRMSSFYVTPRCSPSRAALLTGRHSHDVGVGVLTSDDRPYGYRGSPDPTAPTLAERLRSIGYTTALAGKWHLSAQTAEPDETWPTRRGFDEFYGVLPGAVSYYGPPLVDGEERLPPSATAGDYYLTDDLTRYARDFVERAHKGGRPWFLYLAYTAPHWPLHAREADVAKYRERYLAGWDRLRERRLAEQHRLGLETAADLPARDLRVPAWAETSEPEWEAERMAVYAAQVEAMDRGVGALLDQLEAQGTLDDTLVVFCSDNGACAEELPTPSGRLPVDVSPPTTRDGRAVRVGNSPDVVPGPEDSYASYGRSWAHLSNTPFRLYKRWVHEGGIASPLIASWPAGGVLGGGRTAGPGHVVDIAPTVLRAVGGDTSGMAGASMLDQWRGEAAVERPLFWEHLGNAAVRYGQWKLVREAGRPWELYDILADRGETHDLAAEHADVVTRLEHCWEVWARSTGVIEWDRLLEYYRMRGLEQSVLPD